MHILLLHDYYFLKRNKQDAPSLCLVTIKANNMKRRRKIGVTISREISLRLQSHRNFLKTVLFQGQRTTQGLGVMIYL